MRAAFLFFFLFFWHDPTSLAIMIVLGGACQMQAGPIILSRSLLSIRVFGQHGHVTQRCALCLDNSEFWIGTEGKNLFVWWRICEVANVGIPVVMSHMWKKLVFSREKWKLTHGEKQVWETEGKWVLVAFQSLIPGIPETHLISACPTVWLIWANKLPFLPLSLPLSFWHLQLRVLTTEDRKIPLDLDPSQFKR